MRIRAATGPRRALFVSIVCCFALFALFLGTRAPSPQVAPTCNSDALTKAGLATDVEGPPDVVVPSDLPIWTEGDNVSRVLGDIGRRGLRTYINDYTLREYLSLETRIPLAADDVAFVIMGSAATKPRLRSLWATWLATLNSSSVFVFGDESDPDLHMKTLPELRGRKGYIDSGQRQLRGMQHLAINSPDLVAHFKWFILIDDDSFINVPLLFSYLADFPPSAPLAIGHVWDSLYHKGLVYHHGSAVAISYAAFELVSRALYTTCPCYDENDITLGYCFPLAGVLKIHSPRFHYEQGRTTGLHNMRLNQGGLWSSGWGLVLPSDISHYISVHHIQTHFHMQTLTCITAKLFNWKSPGCESFVLQSSYAWLPEEDNSGLIWCLLASFVLVALSVAYLIGKRIERDRYNDFSQKWR